MTQGFYEQLGIGPSATAAQVRDGYAQALNRLAKRRSALVEQGGDVVALDLARAQLDEAFAVLSDTMRRRRYDAMLAFQDRVGAFAQIDGDQLWSQTMVALIHPGVAAGHELLRVSSRLQVGELPAAPRPGGASVDVFPDAETSVGTSPTAVPDAGTDVTYPGPAARLPHNNSAYRNNAHDDSVGDLTAPAARVAPIAATSPRASSAATGPGTVVPLNAASGQPASTSASKPAPPSLAMPKPSMKGANNPTASSVVSLPKPSVPAPTGGSPLKVVDGTPGSGSVLVLQAQPPALRDVSSEDIAQMVDNLGYSGALLRAVREARGLGLQDVADATRISERYLQAIEGDKFDALPSATFVRGYVREMARLLHLDDAEVVAGYMRRMQG